jgi:hypothetical protein
MRSWVHKLFLPGRCGEILLVALFCTQGAILESQVQQPQTPNPPPTGTGQGRVNLGQGDGEEQDNPVIHRAAVVAQMKRNVQRQQQIVKDTDRLMELAQQLKEEVAKGNKSTLSTSVAKKAEEIERLAKSVKDKMKAE